MKRLVIGIFAAIVVIVLFIVLCTFVRRPYEVVLLDRWGRLIPEESQSRIAYNWYLKMPWDGVVRIDSRLHLKTLPLQEFVTAKKEPVSVRPFAVWRIVDAVKFRQKAGGSDQVAEGIMEERIRALVGQTFGKHQLEEFFNTDPNTEAHLREVETKIATDATKGSDDGKIPGINDLGIEIADIGFSRVAFPPGNTDAVYTRMVAALNEQARSYEAEGVKVASITRSDGALQAAKIRSEAISAAEQIRGEGDREANEIITSVATTDATREFYQYWKSLEFLKASLVKNNILVLSTDNPIVKALFVAPTKNSPPPGQQAPAK